MVGIAGFEPATLRSQSECASQTALYPDTKVMAREVRLELTTHCLEGSCSIQLSYSRKKNGATCRDRTDDILITSEVLYQLS